MHEMYVDACQCRGECCTLGSFKNNYIYLDFYKFYISFLNTTLKLSIATTRQYLKT